MSSAGVGYFVFMKGTMDKTFYLNLLKNILLQSAEKFCEIEYVRSMQDRQDHLQRSGRKTRKLTTHTVSKRLQDGCWPTHRSQLTIIT